MISYSNPKSSFGGITSSDQENFVWYSIGTLGPMTPELAQEVTDFINRYYYEDDHAYHGHGSKNNPILKFKPWARSNDVFQFRLRDDFYSNEDLDQRDELITEMRGLIRGYVNCVHLKSGLRLVK